MRKINFIPLMVLLCTVLNAQQAVLKVGDHAPEIKAFRWLKGQPINNLQGKIHVIEFGATWCTPCARAIPELSQLQEKHKDIQVTSFFVMEANSAPLDSDPSYLAAVEKYLAKRNDKMNYAIALDDPRKTMETNWLKAAGMGGVPDIFVIDKNGVIAAIGSSVKEIEPALNEVLKNNYVLTDLVNKQTNSSPKFDQAKLLLIGGNGGKEDDFLFRSILTRYDGKTRAPNPDFVENFSWAATDTAFLSYQDRFQVIGVSIADLYYMAYADTVSNVVHFRGVSWEYPDTVKNPRLRTTYGKDWFEPVLEVSDKSPFYVVKNKANNKYNYSLKVPKGVGSASFLQSVFQRDLKTYFGYDVIVEKRQMPCWNLILVDEKVAASKLFSKNQKEKLSVVDIDGPFIFKNADVKDIITMLAATYGYGLLDYGKLPRDKQAPFFNTTGISKRIDYVVDKTLTFEANIQYLNSLGLDLIKSTRQMTVIVIRDPKP